MMAGESGVEEVTKKSAVKKGRQERTKGYLKQTFLYQLCLVIEIIWLLACEFAIVSHPYKTGLSLDVLSYFAVATNQRF